MIVIQIYIWDRRAQKQNELMNTNQPEQRSVPLRIKEDCIVGYWTDEETGRIILYTTAGDFEVKHTHGLLEKLEEILSCETQQ